MPLEQKALQHEPSLPMVKFAKMIVDNYSKQLGRLRREMGIGLCKQKY